MSYRDVALYALGVGAAGADPCNTSELPFVYHPSGQSFIKVPAFVFAHFDSIWFMETLAVLLRLFAKNVIVSHPSCLKIK